MKKHRIFGVCLMMAVLSSASVFGQGYQGPGLPPVTVQEAKSLRDDSPVVLRGKIERFLGDEKYTFTDDSGSIIIEIDNRLWKGLSVDQNDTVEITGEVDKDFTRTKVEASSIKIL
jgi:uncharacterized protein (TIGR00156 family)